MLRDNHELGYWATKSDLDSCKIRGFALLLIYGGGVEQSILIIILSFSEVFETNREPSGSHCISNPKPDPTPRANL